MTSEFQNDRAERPNQVLAGLSDETRRHVLTAGSWRGTMIRYNASDHPPSACHGEYRCPFLHFPTAPTLLDTKRVVVGVDE